MAILYDFEDGLIPDGWSQPVDANAGFVIASVNPYAGSYCLKSATIADDQNAGIEVTKTCYAGSISFFRKCSTEANYDELLFYIDGVLENYTSGITSWNQSSATVSAGVHTFKWVYKKDSSTIAGDDAVWLDNINIPEAISSVSIPVTNLSFDIHSPLTSPLFIPSIQLPITEQVPFCNYAIIPALQLVLECVSPIYCVKLLLPSESFLFELTAPEATQILTQYFGVHRVEYSTTALSFHRVSYEGTNTVINLHYVEWSQQAISLHSVEWSDSALVSTFAIHESSWASIGSSSAIALHESYWQSVGSSSTIALHESSWSSLLRSTAQAAQEAFYGTIGTSTLIGLHEAGWASVGGLASVMGLHELGWSFTPSAMSLQSASFQSVIKTLSLHEVYYETYQTSVIMTLHECRYRSNQVTPIINTGLIYARI